MLLPRFRPLVSALAVQLRAASAFVAATALLGLAAPRVAAQTAGAADIAPANLPGKTITLNATNAGSPFVGTGIFSITFTGTTYTMPIAAGNPTFYSGSYTASSSGSNTVIRLAGYLVGGSPVTLELIPSAASLIPGAFEMYADGVPANKRGSFTVSGGATGGGGTGNPAVTSQTQVAATVGQPFVYQITTSPAATSYANTGGNAPVAISPGSGLVTGTFTTAGTFTFSFTATNASGTSAVTVVTVVATAGSSSGGGSTGGGSTGSVVARSAIAWGWNLSGQTSVPANLANLIAIAAGGQHSLAVRADGTVAAWGSTTQTTLPSGLTGVVAVSAGSNHSVALKSDGSVVQWGNTADGQRTNFPSDNTGFTAISAKYFHTLGLKSNGTVVAWGADPAFGGVSQPPAGLNNVKAVAAGVGFDLALKTDGTVVAWTSPRFSTFSDNVGQADVPAGLNNVAAIAAGQFHALALKTDGTVVGWGGARGSRGFTVPAAAATDVVAIACGFEHSIVLKRNGTVVAWGLNSFGQTTVPSTATDVKLIAANEYFNLALVGTGTGGSTGGSTGGGTTVAVAPTNLVGYRNRVGSVFEFTVTGATGGAVWGTDVYTDDSSVARAAVHAGVLAVGETKTVTVTILPGQPSYPASTRNGVASASWGSWSGSYSFAGAGAVTTGTAVAATARPAVAPGYTALTTTLAAGGRFVLPINVTGGGTYTYQWYLNGIRLAGATANPYVVAALSASDAGTYTVDVTNALGTARLTAGTVTVGNAGSPVLTLQPIAKNVVPGGTFTVAASATGSGLTYQWLRNGTVLPGETGAILLRNNASANDAGSYSVRVTNAAGSVTSNAATITLSAAASRPANISVRTAVATGATVIPGFVVQGTGTKRVLIRAVGPGLAAFGLGGTMADPKFAVFQGTTQVAANDDWSAANIGNAFSATGAFALPAGSKDAALVTDLAAGRDYTVQVTNASGTGGIVLIEVYDADALRGTSTSKLVNVSVRGQTAPGDDILTLGLVIGGEGPRTLLVRGIGPKLAAFGVDGTVADPRLQIFDSQQRAILANDDWSNADFVSELALATNYVGAFALDAGSKDAATLSLVQPGAYTIQVVGAAAAPTGEALVEVYEVP